MPDTSRLPATALAATVGALAATVGALAGWWWQSRVREDALTERTRARLRRWEHR